MDPHLLFGLLMSCNELVEEALELLVLRAIWLELSQLLFCGIHELLPIDLPSRLVLLAGRLGQAVHHHIRPQPLEELLDALTLVGSGLFRSCETAHLCLGE